MHKLVEYHNAGFYCVIVSASSLAVVLQDSIILSAVMCLWGIGLVLWNDMLGSAIKQSKEAIELAKQAIAENELILETNRRMRREIAEMDGWESDIEHTPVPDAVQKKMREIFDDNC